MRSLNFPILSRRPIVIALLLTAAILFFVAVSQLVQAFDRHQTRLAAALYQRGESEIQSGHPDRAVTSLGAALSFRHENPQYQLAIARALRDTGRLDESETYLLRLWEQSPENSEISLALARLAVKRKSEPEALRYYHNAVYGAWPSDSGSQRDQARFELIDYLLQQHAYSQAQSELIAFTPQLPDDPDTHVLLARLFFEAQDYAHAQGEYLRALHWRHTDQVALAGAGRSVFQLGEYRSASRYFEAALRLQPSPDLQGQLVLSQAILELNPFASRISDADRVRRLRKTLGQLSQRLSACRQVQPTAVTMNDLQSELESLQTDLKRRTFESSELADRIFNLVSRIENQPCGPATVPDRALLLIAQNLGGIDR